MQLVSLVMMASVSQKVLLGNICHEETGQGGMNPKQI